MEEDLLDGVEESHGCRASNAVHEGLNVSRVIGIDVKPMSLKRMTLCVCELLISKIMSECGEGGSKVRGLFSLSLRLVGDLLDPRARDIGSTIRQTMMQVMLLKKRNPLRLGIIWTLFFSIL